MSEIHDFQDLAVEEQLGRAADEFTERLDRGEQPDIEEYASRYPRLAALIREIFPTLVALRSPDVADLGVAGRPGRRLGRGSWVISNSSARSAAAAWGSSTRPCSARSTAAWR